MTQPQLVALLGTSDVGTAMARGLVQAGYRLRVWNRVRERAEPLGELGAHVAGTPAEAVSGADVVITMLATAESVAATVARAAGRFRTGALWIQASTVGLDGVSRLAKVASNHGLVFLDAPVLVAAQWPAGQRPAVVLASGPDDARSRSLPVLEAIADRALWLGPAGRGTRLRLAATAWELTMIEGVAAALSLAQGLGLPPHLLLDAVRGTAVDAPALQRIGSGLLAGQDGYALSRPDPSHDARLAAEAADASGLDLTVLEAALAHVPPAEPEPELRLPGAASIAAGPGSVTAGPGSKGSGPGPKGAAAGDRASA